MPPEDAHPRRFAAFISYRHLDNAEEGRRWASWLHWALENYRVPEALRGKRRRNGHLIPSHLYPVFRDEEELNTARPLEEL